MTESVTTNEKGSRKKNVSKIVFFVALAFYWISAFSFVLTTYLSNDFSSALFVFGFFSSFFTVIVISGLEAIPKLFIAD